MIIVISPPRVLAGIDQFSNLPKAVVIIQLFSNVSVENNYEKYQKIESCIIL